MVFPWMFASNWFLEKDVKRWFFWEQLGCRKPSHYLILQMWGCHHSLHPNCLATLVRSLWTCDGSRENHTKVSSWLMQSLKNCRSLKKCRSLNLRPHLMRKKPRCRLSLTDWVTSRTSWISFHHVSSQPGSFALSVVKHLDRHWGELRRTWLRPNCVSSSEWLGPSIWCILYSRWHKTNFARAWATSMPCVATRNYLNSLFSISAASAF